jgi:stage III sporulation protein AH
MGLKRKQIVVLSLVIMVVIAGYIQYSYKKSSVSTMDKDSGKVGEAVFVDNNTTQSTGNTVSKASSDVKASKQANDFFTQAKLDKEVARSKDTDDLRQITEDVNAPQESKNKAYDNMMSIIGDSEKELKIETLVKKIGFDDVIALLSDDSSVDVIVKAPSMTTSQIAQISDIVSREAKVDMNNIHVKNKY